MPLRVDEKAMQEITVSGPDSSLEVVEQKLCGLESIFASPQEGEDLENYEAGHVLICNDCGLQHAAETKPNGCQECGSQDLGGLR